MKIDILSAVPSLMDSFFEHSILKRAQEQDIIQIKTHNIRDYTNYKHGQIDDYQYGGGAGLVLMIEPIVNAIEALQKETNYDEIIYLTPDGDLFNQQTANRLSLKKNLLLICGHYKGIDQRIRDHFVTMEISIGQYVMSGGELGAAVVADTICRLIPGVLNDESSALFDSFQDDLLAPPIYTRPEEFRGWKVPPVLLSGDHRKIQNWREDQSLKRTNTMSADENTTSTE